MSAKALRGYAIQISDTHISDLFFNSELTNYRGLWQRNVKGLAKTMPTQQQITNALTLDAQQFATCLGKSADKDFAPAVVQDFMARV